MLNCNNNAARNQFSFMQNMLAESVFHDVDIPMNYCISCNTLIFKPNLSSSVFIGLLSNVYIISFRNGCVCVCVSESGECVYSLHLVYKLCPFGLHYSLWLMLFIRSGLWLCKFIQQLRINAFVATILRTEKFLIENFKL